MKAFGPACVVLILTAGCVPREGGTQPARAPAASDARSPESRPEGSQFRDGVAEVAGDVDVDVDVELNTQRDHAAASSERGRLPDESEEPETEEREANPRSETVSIQIIVQPYASARVQWGAKDLGKPPIDLKRPRYSGPVDLVIRAPGYLTAHTRAFTDRDDKLTVRLVPVGAAPGLWGYRRPEPTPAARPR